MLSTHNIVILPVAWDHPDGIHLRNLQRTEIAVLGGLEPGIPPSAADVPVFLVAYCNDIPVGCGGLRPLSSPPDGVLIDAAEIKRMFVDTAYRGPLNLPKGSRGTIAELILERLEGEALERGWSLLLLETGTFLAKARRFYERRGFVQRDMFGDYNEADNSVCYEKRLASAQMASITSPS
ncbi:hypothetical protein PFICI_05748 [Pestalotiopsis fici W106-1]|uniref:N-acetyltransferase domain-containing protein n=1 Tax=Pestalotiopsis fici (strain W106-1 / CGMCC3.15140) TaxID=1229662 RepID=W3XEP5_PESFW|nr:uncharacterized protein PFICI_05748 [Pestalotiopsis fici W106-1]ETS83872.1 hypothetical protein PFICI_05748 [Pestalotiopsis fici W106-1]